MQVKPDCYKWVFLVLTVPKSTSVPIGDNTAGDGVHVFGVFTRLFEKVLEISRRCHVETKRIPSQNPKFLIAINPQIRQRSDKSADPETQFCGLRLHLVLRACHEQNPRCQPGPYLVIRLFTNQVMPSSQKFVTKGSL